MRVAWVLGLTAAITTAQQVDEVRVTAHLYTPPQPHLSARTNLVQMEVVVRDTRGHAVGGLTPNDFEILGEGNLRTIAGFSVETRTVAQPAGSTRGFIGEPVDAGGKMVAAKEGEMDLALKDDSLARLTGSGVNAGLKLAAPPGAYKLRVVVQDAEGRMASQDRNVEAAK